MTKRHHRATDEEILETLPAGVEEAPRSIRSAWGLFEVLLKAPDRVNPFIRLPEMQGELSFRFGLITVVGMSLYALSIFAALYFAPPEAVPGLLRDRWDHGTAGLAGLLAAYPAGVLASTFLVLPSYWFLCLLCGVKMPLGEVLTHSLKGKAATTVLVLGIMPIYGVVLAVMILARLPGELINPFLWLSLLLPFVAGLRGAGAIESGFRNVVATTPDLSRSSRAAIPVSLIVLWGLLFTLTAPLVMYRAWDLVTLWVHGT
ncbi:MAG: hypothetical protein U0840_15170 [Gemmataceae bacterium]